MTERAYAIIDRIRANGGELFIDGYRLRIRRGRLTDSAMAYIAQHREEIHAAYWDGYDQWAERAAILEYDAGLTRDEAEAEAYRKLAPTGMRVAA